MKLPTMVDLNEAHAHFEGLRGLLVREGDEAVWAALGQFPPESLERMLFERVLYHRPLS